MTQSIWHYALLAGCVLVAVVAVLIAVLFMAFADSPEANLAVRRAAVPTIVWLVAALIIARHCLNYPAAWWSYPIAYLAAASPPVVLIGATLLQLRSRKSRHN
jgi:cytochrome bd-type quinol oxidase subunit 2